MPSYFIDPHECSPREIFPGVRIRVVSSDHIMLSWVELDPHSVVQTHQHPQEQAGIIFSGQCEFTIGDETRVMGPGQMYLIPGNVPHRVVALDEPVRALDVFSPPREDYRAH